MLEFGSLWKRATSAELAWIDAAGAPAALTAVPLADGSAPCVAITYDRAPALASLAGAAAVAFAVTDSRSLPAGSRAAAAVGRVSLVDHVAGGLDEALLTQELRKFPPSRALADSLLLRRENWWYVARILVRLDRVDEVRELDPRRAADRDALLVRHDGRDLRLDVGAADDWTAPQIPLRADAALRGDGAEILAHGHDFSPDRERWESWTVRGRLRGNLLDVSSREGAPGLDARPLRLLERLRRSRALERACRHGIAGVERDRRADRGGR